MKYFKVLDLAIEIFQTHIKSLSILKENFMFLTSLLLVLTKWLKSCLHIL